jgi:hypothetical protein
VAAVIRIFVGTPANNEDLESQSVLEWSIRKRASEPVDITWMKASNDPRSTWHGWLMRNWATPFSAFRWSIPEHCGFEGRAIYLDIDMIVLADIAELWHHPMSDNQVCIAKNPSTFCCTLWDCARAQKYLPRVAQLKSEYGLYARVKRNFPVGTVGQFANGNWNCLDGEQYANLHDPDLKILHCTSIPTQPQLRHALPRLRAAGGQHWSRHVPQPHPRKDVVELFDAMLDEAIANGYPPEKYQATPFGKYHR